MFLRHTKRKKDGKEHRYWSIVENRRIGGGRVVQRPLLYLGEINDSQELAWRKSIAILEEGALQPRTLALSLWRELELDRFWGGRLPPSRKGTRWDRVLLLLATYRLLAPGSEWRLHREWFERSAMADLLGEDLGLAEIPSCIAVTTGCSNTSRPCSIIWSGAGATCSTSASMCCSTI